MLEPWALSHRRWKKRLAWCLYQRADLKKAAALHATAEAEATQFRSLGLANPITVIPNGVDVPELERSPYSGQRIRTALFLSRLHPKKGLPLLVEAWAKIRPINWRMRVAGPDESGHAATVKELVRAAGLEKSWEFVGEIGDSQKWAVYERAHLFVLPSHSENFGMVVAEALAAGLPVIATQGCPWQGLENHSCGWWVASTVEALTHALQEAFATPDSELFAMGARGRSWMQAEFGWNMVAQRMTALYEEVFRRKDAL
jgi:glycosyltransferase involved in cell wall biosynthesis